MLVANQDKVTVAKSQLKLRNLRISGSQTEIRFDIYIGNELRSMGSMNLSKMELINENAGGDILVELGEEGIKILLKELGNHQTVRIRKFTPDDIIMLRSMGMSGISGIDNYRDLLF